MRFLFILAIFLGACQTTYHYPAAKCRKYIIAPPAHYDSLISEKIARYWQKISKTLSGNRGDHQIPEKVSRNKIPGGINAVEALDILKAMESNHSFSVDQIKQNLVSIELEASC